MNTSKTLLFILLAWSSTQLTALPSFAPEHDPLADIFFDLDLNLDLNKFALLLNEETVEAPAQDINNFVDNMQTVLLGTLTHLVEEEFLFTFDGSDALNFIAQEPLNEGNEEISLEKLTIPSEETQEVLTFVDQLGNKNNKIDALFQDNGFFQGITPEILGLFDEELFSLKSITNAGEENIEEDFYSLLRPLAFAAINSNVEANRETELAFSDFQELPSALSGIAFAMVDGLNGLEGEEEKGEENLESKYNVISTEGSRLNVLNAGESKSFDGYLGALCVAVALIVIAAVAKGLSGLRKHEAVNDEETTRNYFEIRDQ